MAKGKRNSQKKRKNSKPNGEVHDESGTEGNFNVLVVVGWLIVVFTVFVCGRITFQTYRIHENSEVSLFDVKKAACTRNLAPIYSVYSKLLFFLNSFTS